MEKELFGAIRDNYYKASSELWYWFKHTHFLLKVIFFIWIFVASILMKIIGFIFSLGVILDKISVWIQSKRRNLLNAVDTSAETLNYKKSSYLTSPLKVFFIFPMALFLGIIPKWSSTLAVSLHPDVDISEAVEHGYFIKLGKSYLNFIKALFVNIKGNGFFFGAFSLLISLATSPFFLIMSLIFFVLIILDWFSFLVGLIRKFVVGSSQAMANRSGNNAMNTVLMPLLLVLFVPLYLFLLLIPKIASEVSSA